MVSHEDRLVVVASFVNPYEAHIARSLLESEGIQARLDGEHHISMDWLISNAVGGVKVIVHEKDAVVAKKILDHTACEIADEQTGDSSKPRPVVVCPVCNSEDVDLKKLNMPLTVLSILWMGFPIPFVSREMVCNQCSHRWSPTKKS